MPLKLIPPRAGKSPYWYIRGTLYGRTIDASTKERDKKAAQRFKERFEIALAKEDSERRSVATFEVAAELYMNFRNPSERDRVWINRVVKMIGALPIADIRQHTLVSAANELYPRAKPETKNRQVLGIASAILHYAAENNLCPYIRVKKFKEKAPEARAVSREVAEALIAAADEDMARLLIWLFHQGWRISDTLRVQWAHLDLSQGTVRYHISKTDDWRIMPLHPRVVAALKARQGVGRVFKWSDKANLYRDLRPLCAKVGVRFTPHMARHSFATWLANKGVSPIELMEAGGWRDHKSVLRYAKLDPTRVRKTIEKLV